MHFKDAIKGNDAQNCMFKEILFLEMQLDHPKELKIKDCTAQVRSSSNVISSVHIRKYIRDSCFQ